MRVLFFCTIYFLAIQGVLSSEVDEFTQASFKYHDVTKVLNEKANEILDEAVVEANKRGSCNKFRLYDKIRVRFRNQFQDKFSKWVHNSDTVFKRKVGFKKSIYREWTPIESPAIAGLGIVSDTTGYIIKMGDYIFGTDKWEHFFGRGHRYFKMYYLDGDSIEEVMDYGHGLENGRLGLKTSGIYSYGDLAANFKGMLFWNHLLGEGQEIMPVAGVDSPYLACVKGAWKRVRPVAIEKYLDHGFEEAINCSAFKTEIMVEKVEKQLARLSAKAGKEITCPLNKSKFAGLAKIYGPFAKYMINFDGIKTLSR